MDTAPTVVMIAVILERRATGDIRIVDKLPPRANTATSIKHAGNSTAHGQIYPTWLDIQQCKWSLPPPPTIPLMLAQLASHLSRQAFYPCLSILRLPVPIQLDERNVLRITSDAKSIGRLVQDPRLLLFRSISVCC